MTIREELDYQDGTRIARSYMNAGFAPRELRNHSCSRSDAFCNGFHDEVSKQHKEDLTKISVVLY
jgi:hypothetical protein